MGGPGSGRKPLGIREADLPTGELVPVLARPEEALVMQRLTSALNTSIIGNRNPMWNDADELQLMKETSFQMFGDVTKLLSFTVQNSPGSTVGINERFAKRYPVSDLNVPRNPLAVVQMSLRYALENPFVAKALRVKADFACKDFQHKTKHKEAKRFYDNFARQMRIRSMLPKICWNLFATGLCPIYWGGEDGGPLTFMQVLSPAAVHVEEILGKMKLWIKITPAMVAAVRDPMGERDPQNRAQYLSMPKYWIATIQQAIDKGRATGLIELKDGSYTVIDYRYCPYNRAQNTLDGVPLQAAFDALQRYRLLAAGDFAVAWNVKNMLTLISEGDPKADPKDYKPADNVRLSKLYQQFNSADQALVVFCDPTTNVRYIVPPIEVFNPMKYEQVEKEIKEVLNLPSFMWHSDGNGTFGAATAEVQLLRQEIQAVRMLLEDQFFYPLYVRARQGSTRPGFASDDIPMPSFDQSSLRDDALWLAQNQEMYSRGALSLETLLQAFGYDLDYEMAQKAEEHAKYGNTNENVEVTNNTVARPLFEPSQANLQPKQPGDNKGGRPPNEGTPPDDKSKGRRPRATGD